MKVTVEVVELDTTLFRFQDALVLVVVLAERPRTSMGVTELIADTYIHNIRRLILSFNSPWKTV